MKHRIVLLALFCLASACNLDPEAAKRKYLANGNKYYDRGKYKEALIMYRNALKRDAKFGEAYYRAALTEIKLLQLPQAARSLHRAIELQPDNIDAYSRLINIYLNAYLADKRRPKQFISELKALADKLAKKDPNGYEVTRLNGYLALTDRKPEEAINFFAKAHKIKPYQPDIVLVHMQTLASTGKTKEAEQLGKEMIQKDPKVSTIYDALFIQYLRENRAQDAERILREKVEKNPSVAEFRLQLAAHYYATARRPEMLSTIKAITDSRKDFPRAYQLVGDFFLRIKDLDLAVQNYTEGIKTDAENKAMYQKRIIEAKVLQNKKDEAQQVLNEVLKEDPKDSEAIAIRASLNMLSGTREQLQSAINDLQTVVSRLPDNPVVRFNLGRAHLARGDWQQAKVQFEESVKLRPDYLLPRIALAQIAQQNGEFGKVLQMSQEILVYDAANLPARLLRTRALIGMNEIKQARQELDTLTKSFPNVWEGKLQLAALDLAEKNYKSAEEIFKQMYSVTNDGRALMGLTETYVAQGNFRLAIDTLEQEVKNKPERLDFRVALGNIAARTDDFGTAENHFKAALEKIPRSADVWIRLGETQRRAGNMEAAKVSFTKARELAPNNIAPTLQLAVMHDTAGEKDRARPLYEQVLRLQPDNAIALNNLAYLMAEAGTDLDQALTLAQRARQKRPEDPNIADTLGWIYIKKNLSDSAITIFRELVKNDPSRSTFRYHLAMALVQKGDKPQARKELEIALKSKPAKDEESKIKELMAKM